MPNTKSAKKRLRQNTARRTLNRGARATLRTQLKSVKAAAAAGDATKADAEYRTAARKLDRAGAHSLIHPNKAARLKSRLQRMLKKAKPSTTSSS